MEQFQLQKGEKVIRDVKPLPVLKWYFFFMSAMAVIIFFMFFSFFLFIPALLMGALGLLGAFSILILIILVILYLIANNRYNYQHYWLTNQRILYRRGLIGYTLSSMPLERISDVIISRTFLENIFGFGSIHVETLAGQMSYSRYGRWGAEGSLIAIPDPEGTQKLIFELIKKKRKTEKLSF